MALLKSFFCPRANNWISFKTSGGGGDGIFSFDVLTSRSVPASHQLTACSVLQAMENKIQWMGFYATIMLIWAKLGQKNLLRMVRWMRWHCPPDTWFKIRALAVWGRARYLSVTEAPHNIESLRVSGVEIFVSLKLEGQSGAQTRDLRLPKQAPLYIIPLHQGPHSLVGSLNSHTILFIDK